MMNGFQLAQLSRLQWAFIFSGLIHALVLGVHFSNPGALERLWTDTGLDVVLVNAKSDKAPRVAQAIAQANLEGGGSAQSGRAKTPLPALQQDKTLEALDEAKQEEATLEKAQQELLTRVHQQIRRWDVDNQTITDPQQKAVREAKRQQLIRLLGEIEERIEANNARPQKRYIGPATKEAVYAMYYSQLRERIEERGTEIFPTDQGQKLYGELTMAITVHHTGQVLLAQIVKSSGNRLLDGRAQAIVYSAGPFGAFSPAMRAQAEQVVVISTFRFAHNNTLQTELKAPAH